MGSFLDDTLAQLEPQHARALEWFVDHEGEIGPRPWRVAGESVVPGVSIPVVARRGIHQPAGWDIALSITATTNSLYLDGKPERIDSETWVLPYRAHHGGDGSGLESRWNRALFGNIRKRTPVGVFVPQGGKYLNLGLATVESYDSGSATFLLRGPVRHTQAEGTWDEAGVESTVVRELSISSEVVEEPVLARVRRRIAQEQFREALVSAYDGRCAISGYDAVDALQGAHILAYTGRSSQLVENGLLLRADIHLLFDRHLVSVEPETHRVRVGSQIAHTAYGNLDMKPLLLPEHEGLWPAQNRLAVHWAVFERAADS